MNNETSLHNEVSEMILALADEQQQLTRSDFQSRVDVVASKIIRLVQGAINGDIGSAR
jgi:hypothetical protein